MADAPLIVMGSDGKTPTTATKQQDGSWAQPVAAKDGHIVTLGKTADPAVTDPTQAASAISLLKGTLQQFQATQEKQQAAIDRLTSILEQLAGTLQVTGAVSVNNLPANQPVTVANPETAPVPVVGRVDATLTGSNVSFVQKPDVVTTNTVITAGSNVIFKDTGDQPWILGSGQRRVAAGYSVGATAKSRLSVIFYSATYPYSYPLKEVTLVDNTGTATASGAGITDALSNRYVLRVFNTDSVDITLKVLTRAEVG